MGDPVSNAVAAENTLRMVSLIGVLVLFLATIIPFSKILRRAGWSGWLSLLMLIPLANLILLWVFAFGRCPTCRKMSGALDLSHLRIATNRCDLRYHPKRQKPGLER